MEVHGYLRNAGARRWLLILAPLVAAAVSVSANTEDVREAHVTTGTVVVPLLYDNASPTATLQSVASFRSALSTDAVRQRVAEETGVSVAGLQRGLVSRAPAATELVEISWTSAKDEPDGSLVIASAVDEAWGLLTRSRVVSADKVTEAARAAVAAAAGALRDFERATGHIMPEQDYRVLASELSTFRVALENARLDDDPDRAAALEQIVEDRRARLDTLGRQVPEHGRLKDQLAEAQRRLESAQQAAADVHARAEIAGGASMLDVTGTRSVRVAPPAAQAAGVGAALGLAAATLLLAILELLRPSRPGRRTQGAPGGVPDDGERSDLLVHTALQ